MNLFHMTVLFAYLHKMNIFFIMTYFVMVVCVSSIFIIGLIILVQEIDIVWWKDKSGAIFIFTLCLLIVCHKQQ
jgi:hypothetical protein